MKPPWYSRCGVARKPSRNGERGEMDERGNRERSEWNRTRGSVARLRASKRDSARGEREGVVRDVQKNERETMEKNRKRDIKGGSYTVRASWEQEGDRIRGGGVITLATLTRRRPDSRSRSTRSARLRLTYTPTQGLPLHLVPSPLVPLVFSTFVGVPLRHPGPSPPRPPTSLRLPRLPS